MASLQVVEKSVANNSPSQDSNHPDDLFQSSYVTPGFKPFCYLGYSERVPICVYRKRERRTKRPEVPLVIHVDEFR